MPLGQNGRETDSLLDSIRRSLPRRRASGKSDFIDIAEELSDVEESALVKEVEATTAHGPEESLLDVHEDKENDEPNLGASEGKRKKRKSVARKFTRPKKRSSTGSLEEEQAEQSRKVNSEQSSTRDKSVARSNARRVSVFKAKILPLSVRHEGGVAIPTKAPRATKQLQQATAIDDTATLSKATSKARQDIATSTEEGDPEAEDSVLSLQNNGPSKKRRKRKSIVVKKRNGRRISAQSTTSASPKPRPQRAQVRTASPVATPYREADENEDETYVPEDISPEPPTPAITKTRKNARVLPSIESDNTVPHRQRSTSSEPKTGLPITTHRLTNTSALPTITEDNEATSSDELNPISSTRTAPNAVDVLAQICRETVSAALAKFRATATSSGLKRKVEALESFGQEIESRLFDMSAAVENRLTLEARVRTSKREKSSMQARWVEVRSQREEVALRMDRVRREHWESEEVGAQGWKLSEGLFGVGVVMEREKGSETDGLEGLISAVGQSVSGFEGGGVLQRVKEFNARMERMVEVLGGVGADP